MVPVACTLARCLVSKPCNSRRTHCPQSHYLSYSFHICSPLSALCTCRFVDCELAFCHPMFAGSTLLCMFWARDAGCLLGACFVRPSMLSRFVACSTCNTRCPSTVVNVSRACPVVQVAKHDTQHSVVAAERLHG